MRLLIHYSCCFTAFVSAPVCEVTTNVDGYSFTLVEAAAPAAAVMMIVIVGALLSGA
jgi:hypothetical protein